jgi:hypothetical protein
MVKKNETILSLDEFVKKVGVPETLLCDNNSTMEGWSEWQKRIRKYSINPKYTEPYSPFQNKAELDIREITKTLMDLLGTTMREDPKVHLPQTADVHSNMSWDGPQII